MKILLIVKCCIHRCYRRLEMDFSKSLKNQMLAYFGIGNTF